MIKIEYSYLLHWDVELQFYKGFFITWTSPNIHGSMPEAKVIVCGNKYGIINHILWILILFDDLNQK